MTWLTSNYIYRGAKTTAPQSIPIKNSLGLRMCLGDLKNLTRLEAVLQCFDVVVVHESWQITLGVLSISVDRSSEAIVYLPPIPCQGHVLCLREADADFDWNHHWMG